MSELDVIVIRILRQVRPPQLRCPGRAAPGSSGPTRSARLMEAGSVEDRLQGVWAQP